MDEKAKVPEVRFASFTDPWEQRELKELCSVITKGTTPLDKKSTGTINFIKVENINNENGEITISQRITEEEHNGYLQRSKLEAGDILFSIAGTLGRVTSVPTSILPANTNQALAIIRLKKGNLEFIKTYLRSEVVAEYIRKNPTVGAQPNLSLDQIGKLKVSIPNEKEQICIGQTFASLDNLLTLHQRKYEQLKKVKASLLQKMFPKEGKNVPELRFAGFTDPWEQRKLGEVFEEYSEKQHEELPPLMVVQGEGTLKREESDRFLQYDKSNLSNYKLARKDDFILHLRSFEGGLEIVNCDGIVSPAYHIFHGNTINPLFYYTFFRSRRFIDVLLKPHVYGIRDGKSIDVEGMKTIKIPYTSLEEQNKIGGILGQLDNLLTLHQRKYEQLKKVKASLLQKMFPKEGKNVPELRFAGFTDPWEQRKLGNYIVDYTEVTTRNNQYPPLTSSRKGIFLQTEYFAGNQIASADNTGYNIVPYGYFTYRHMSDDEIFHFNINDIVDKGIVSTLYPVFTTTEELDSRFLQYQLNYGHEFAKFAILQKQGGSRTYMYLNKLKELSLTMPCFIEEQKKVSGCLLKIDNLLTLHQRKCEQLKAMKTALLQKMFV